MANDVVTTGIDPRTNVDTAKAWTTQFMTWLAWVDTNTQRWYAAMVERIAVGACSCKAINDYNLAAEQAYYWQAWMWDKFDPFFQYMRSVGLNVPIDPPLPKLIGTVYNVYGGTRQLAKFEVFVPCSPNGMADVTKLNTSGQPNNCSRVLPGNPENPSPIAPTWTGHYDLGATVAEGLGAFVVAAVCVTIITVVNHYPAGTDPLSRAIGALDGSTIAMINAQEADKRLEQDATRATIITQCVGNALRMAGPPGTIIPPDQLAKIQTQCEAYGQTTVPDRKPPEAQWGLGKIVTVAGIVAVVGLGAWAYVNSRDKHKSARSA